jgi:hypothetical protein
VLGRPNGWPGERWLDIRRLSILEPVMRQHFIDGFSSHTGFPLTGAEQLIYGPI